MRILTLFTLLIVAIAFQISACRKKDNNSSAPVSSENFIGCRIIKIKETPFDVTEYVNYTITYNSDGKVARIDKEQPKYKATNHVLCFYYPGYMIVNNDEAPYKTDSITFDPQNRVASIYHKNYSGSPSTQMTWEIYSYDSAGALVSAYFNKDKTPYSQYFRWQYGDLQWCTKQNGYTNYEYDSALYNTGNMKVTFTDFEKYGISVYSSVHRCSRALLDNTYANTYTYTTDDHGNITKMIFLQDGKYPSTTDITYECK